MTNTHEERWWEKKIDEMMLIKARFNPREPIYGEENRRDLIRLKEVIAEIESQTADKVRSEIRKELMMLPIHKYKQGQLELLRFVHVYDIITLPVLTPPQGKG